jgi:hypothetical protein
LFLFIHFYFYNRALQQGKSLSTLAKGLIIAGVIGVIITAAVLGVVF